MVVSVTLGFMLKAFVRQSVYIYIYSHTPGQKYKTILRNEEKDIVYNFLIMKIQIYER